MYAQFPLYTQPEHKLITFRNVSLINCEYVELYLHTTVIDVIEILIVISI